MTLTQRSNLLIGGFSGAIAIVTALPIFNVVSDTPPFGYLVAFAFPGIMASMGISGNGHAFSSWLVVLFNWIFYVVILLALRKLMRIFREK